MKHAVLYLTLLAAAMTDHFYQLGRTDESRSNTERIEQDLTESYTVTDALLTKYEALNARNCFLEDRIHVLAKANRMMLDRMSESELSEVMHATLPPLERPHGR